MTNTVAPPCLIYRAFAVNEHGRLGSLPQIIEAVDDADAARQAETFGLCQSLELWEGARLVGRLVRHRPVVMVASMALHQSDRLHAP